LNDPAAADEEVVQPNETNDRIARIRMELENDLARPADLGHLRSTNEPAPPDLHMTILQTLFDLHGTPEHCAAGQQPRRESENVVRLRAVQCANQLIDAGCSQREAARRLAVNERTLRHWDATRGLPADLRDACPLFAAPPRGRPVVQSPPAQQQAIWSWLDQVGPGVGVPTLRTRFDGMSRAELDVIVKDYRRQWRAQNMRLLHVLHWQRPGTVWAADFAEAPCLIDGHYRYLLAIRDLASGLQLLWQPIAAPTAEVMLAELSVLFALHGAPWILKTDNGSAFIADPLRWYLHHANVFQLFSPPRTPAYNGSIEASIGSLKIRTQLHSELAGHAGLWTSDDVEAARTEANTTARPRRLHGKTPEEVWQARRPLTSHERECFRATAEQFRTEARIEKGLPAHEPLTRIEQAAVDRVAFSRALVAHDLLLFRRRRIPPPIIWQKVAIDP
jgi:transposase InsO family protein